MERQFLDEKSRGTVAFLLLDVLQVLLELLEFNIRIEGLCKLHVAEPDCAHVKIMPIRSISEQELLTGRVVCVVSCEAIGEFMLMSNFDKVN